MLLILLLILYNYFDQGNISSQILPWIYSGGVGGIQWWRWWFIVVVVDKVANCSGMLVGKQLVVAGKI